jgi:glutamine synthetase
MRVSVASAGNDHRLGANEAPPAIVSMFLGDELTEILEGIISGKPVGAKAKQKMILGVHVLPDFPKDSTDRNRTSPFAFTGNKFEFRMLGSSFSVAGPNIVLNTIVADELSKFADILESAKDFKGALEKIVKDTYTAHKRIIFNGNNYSPEWVGEAEKRGLLNLKSTVDAVPAFIAPKNIAVFKKFHIFTEAEMHSRYDILMDNYAKTIHIEALTMIDMVREQVLPAVSAYSAKLAADAAAKKALVPSLPCKMEVTTVEKLSSLEDSLTESVAKLDDLTVKAKMISDVTEQARFDHSEVIPAMADVRAASDQLELIVSREYWPMPTYGDLLFTV